MCLQYASGCPAFFGCHYWDIVLHPLLFFSRPVCTSLTWLQRTCIGRGRAVGAGRQASIIVCAVYCHAEPCRYLCSVHFFRHSLNLGHMHAYWAEGPGSLLTNLLHLYLPSLALPTSQSREVELSRTGLRQSQTRVTFNEPGSLVKGGSANIGCPCGPSV